MKPAQLALPASLRGLVSQLAAALAVRGVEAYATGGFLRDALLGLPVRDLDVSVHADPLELGAELARELDGDYFPLDVKRGRARVLLREHELQLDLMAFSGAIEEDMMARDYTIDAMAAPLAEVETRDVTIIDPAGGLEDLRKRTVRLVSEEALRRDPLRLLRGVRLATALDFELEPGTAEAIRRHAGLLLPSAAHGPSQERLGAGAPSHEADSVGAAAERQRDELLLILGTSRAARGLRLMDELGLLARLLPELEVTRGVEQPKEHHWDVFGHSLAAVEALDMLLSQTEPDGEPARSLWRELWGQLAWWQGAQGYVDGERSSLIKLAGLLHDIGKPETKSFEENGRMRFLGHHHAGADIATRLMRRLRFPSREIDHVRAMIDAHLRPLQMAQAGAPTRKAVYRFFRDTENAGVDTLFLSLADHLATAGPRVRLDGWRRHVALVNYVLRLRLEEPAVVSPSRLVGGDDLMAELGVAPGPLLGELLEAVREAQASGEIATRDQAIALARSHLEALKSAT